VDLVAANEDWANLTGKRKNYMVLACAELAQVRRYSLIMQ
jgi:hypothetical protein